MDSFPNLGHIREGGIQFSLWPTPAFIDQYSLHPVGINVKMYQKLHHYWTAFPRYYPKYHDVNSRAAARNIVESLKLFLEFLTSHNALQQNDLAFTRSLVGYRIEFSLSFVRLPSLEQVNRMYSDLLIVLQTLWSPIMARSVSIESINAKRDELLQFVTAPDFTWNTYNKETSNGTIRTLKPLDMQRLAVLCSTFGIADRFTCKLMNQLTLTTISRLWITEVAVEPPAPRSLLEMRNDALALVYNLTLAMCAYDQDLFDMCQELYPTLPFRWQNGKHSNARFCVYWAERRGRTQSLDDPAMLLIICAKHWMENLRTKKFPSDKFFLGNNAAVIRPTINFSNV